MCKQFITNRWEEVIAISEKRFEKTRKEALKWDKLLESKVVEALKAGNKLIFRYLVNRLERIRRCVSEQTLLRVEKGDEDAVEEALRSLLLCFWEGPKVRFIDPLEQDRLERGEKLYKQFVLGNREWLDVNLQADLIKGDSDSWRVAGNQIHYKSMRNLNKKEYEEDKNTRNYVEAVLGSHNKWQEERLVGGGESKDSGREETAQRKKGRGYNLCGKNTAKGKGKRLVDVLWKGS